MRVFAKYICKSSDYELIPGNTYLIDVTNHMPSKDALDVEIGDWWCVYANYDEFISEWKIIK